MLCEYCNTDCCANEKPCNNMESELDNWFYTDGINILNGINNAMTEQGDDFVLPHNRKELDDLIDKVL